MFCLQKGLAQKKPQLCICFTEKTKYIEVNTSEDSTKTSFTIVRGGFETKEKRKKNLENYQAGPPSASGQPSFTINYYTSKRPERIDLINSNDECEFFITLDQFRQKEFGFPKGIGGSQVIFLKKLPDGSFLKWNPILMARE